MLVDHILWIPLLVDGTDDGLGANHHEVEGGGAMVLASRKSDGQLLLVILARLHGAHPLGDARLKKTIVVHTHNNIESWNPLILLILDHVHLVLEVLAHVWVIELGVVWKEFDEGRMDATDIDNRTPLRKVHDRADLSTNKYKSYNNKQLQEKMDSLYCHVFQNTFALLLLVVLARLFISQPGLHREASRCTFTWLPKQSRKSRREPVSQRVSKYIKFES